MKLGFKKIGFNKAGLTFDSKPFDPLNMSVKGYGIESDNKENDIDPFEVLSILASAKTSDEETSTGDKMHVLKALMDKVDV